MVRRCIVKDCRESDISILSHRFPKTQESALKWQKALKVENYSLEDLQRKFVICTKHFASKSYRNEISNSLNTTAVPNLIKNLDNERIYSTNPTSKQQQQEIIPARCHKLPNQKRKLDDSAILNMANVKLIRLGSSQILQDSNKQDFEETSSHEEIALSNEVEETFECIELQSDSIEDENFQEIAGFSEEPTDQEPDVTYFEQETQTDPPTPAKPEESKDEKLVQILYPEFKHMGKIELIELVKEKNRKIEALNEKIEKLELAMKNLL